MRKFENKLNTQLSQKTHQNAMPNYSQSKLKPDIFKVRNFESKLYYQLQKQTDFKARFPIVKGEFSDLGIQIMLAVRKSLQ